MPPSGPFINASYLSEERHARWLIENLPLKLQIARLWPFLGIAGSSLAYARLNTALSGPLPSTDCSAISDVAQTASQVRFPILDFFTRYQLCFRDLDLYNDPTDLDQALYAIAIRQLIYGYFAMLDSAAGGGGLLDYVAATNKVTMAGGALTLDCLDHAYQLVTANEGRPTVIMSSTRGLRLYQKLCRDKGYDAPKMPWAWYDPATGRMEQRLVTEFNGTPWLVNGLMVSEGSSTATNQRIWFMVLGDDGGTGPTRGVTGIIPRARVGNMFVKRATNGTLGELSVVTPATDTWVSFPAGLAVGSQGALSLIHNFAAPVDCTIG